MNPNPAFITDEMWRLWTDRPIQAWRLSGIYADKKGYHNSVIVNQQKWKKDNYSIQLKLDLDGVKNKARAIDYTMSDSEMVSVTSWLRMSAMRPDDNRLAAVREFYGTLDNEQVFGLIKNDENGPWRFSSSDKSHLWHVHISIFGKFVNQWEMLEPILSVISGQTYEEWSVSKEMYLPKFGDSGDGVNYWQRVFNTARKSFSPSIAALEVDGDYGPKMTAAMLAFFKLYGGTGAYKGEAITGWVAYKLHEDMMKVTSPPVDHQHPVISDETMKKLVNEWLEQRSSGDLTFTGTITGKAQL